MLVKATSAAMAACLLGLLFSCALSMEACSAGVSSCPDDILPELTENLQLLQVGLSVHPGNLHQEPAVSKAEAGAKARDPVASFDHGSQEVEGKLREQHDAEQAKEVVGLAVLVASSKDMANGRTNADKSTWCVLQCKIRKDPQACAECASSQKPHEGGWWSTALNEKMGDRTAVKDLLKGYEAKKQDKEPGVLVADAMPRRVSKVDLEPLAARLEKVETENTTLKWAIHICGCLFCLLVFAYEYFFRCISAEQVPLDKAQALQRSSASSARSSIGASSEQGASSAPPQAMDSEPQDIASPVAVALQQDPDSKPQERSTHGCGERFKESWEELNGGMANEVKGGLLDEQ